MGPDLLDLVGLWLKENAPSFYAERSDPLDPREILGFVYYRGFGSVVTIYEDRININLDNRDPDGLEILAADPKLFALLSNRLYIMEQGFIKANNSRIERLRDAERKMNGT